MNYASAQRRFSAHLIDWVVIVALFALVGFLVEVTALATMSMVGFVFYLSLPFVGWLYFALFESSSWQATPGKKLLGLHVARIDGAPLSFARATGRYFGKWISRFCLMIGFLMVFWTKKKQALHDKLACCIVLKK